MTVKKLDLKKSGYVVHIKSDAKHGEVVAFEKSMFEFLKRDENGNAIDSLIMEGEKKRQERLCVLAVEKAYKGNEEVQMTEDVLADLYEDDFLRLVEVSQKFYDELKKKGN